MRIDKMLSINESTHDCIYVEYEKYHNIKRSNKLSHFWRIQNAGSVPWHERKIICLNYGDNLIEVYPHIIYLPDMEPGQSVRLKTNIIIPDSRKTFHLKWQIQNFDGKNCLPDNKPMEVWIKKIDGHMNKGYVEYGGA